MNATTDALRNALTAQELIEYLQTFDPESKVLFVCDYGDYHHTQQALPVGQVEEDDSRNLKDSAYSQSRVQLVEADHLQPYCEECDDQPDHHVGGKCPTCGSRLVNEEGEYIDEDDESESESIVILR